MLTCFRLYSYQLFVWNSMWLLLHAWFSTQFELGPCKTQTACGLLFSPIVPLSSNPKNNSPQSVRSLHFTLPHLIFGFNFVLVLDGGRRWRTGRLEIPRFAPHPKKYFNKSLQEILFILVFQAACFEVGGEGGGGGRHTVSMGRGVQLRPSEPDSF